MTVTVPEVVEIAKGLADPLNLRVFDASRFSEGSNQVVLIVAYTRNKVIIPVKEVTPDVKQQAVAVIVTENMTKADAESRVHNGIKTLIEGIANDAR
jgi:hypothetical protein